MKFHGVLRPFTTLTIFVSNVGRADKSPSCAVEGFTPVYRQYQPAVRTFTADSLGLYLCLMLSGLQLCGRLVFFTEGDSSTSLTVMRFLGADVGAERVDIEAEIQERVWIVDLNQMLKKTSSYC